MVPLANWDHLSVCKVDMFGYKVDHQSLLRTRHETNLIPTFFPLYLLLLPPPSSCATGLPLGI